MGTRWGGRRGAWERAARARVVGEGREREALALAAVVPRHLARHDAARARREEVEGFVDVEPEARIRRFYPEEKETIEEPLEVQRTKVPNS